ncbi:MucBP domain-containing protein [Levilactobacillus tongjiangensis]|uniref:MucBP domain-containing protein n=1 Tax=Levilactobacillus tongjiangensis TaxID=2486023 RepID=A0ABW1SNW2_9LACO|nr:MucBP domain-containing protein [Levilactobacillus tongjiangensis]
MMKRVLGESKQHYKSYKAGKRWVFASITVISLGLGVTGVNVTAKADAAADSTAESTAVGGQVDKSEQQVNLAKAGEQAGAPEQKQNEVSGQQFDGSANKKTPTTAESKPEQQPVTSEVGAVQQPQQDEKPVVNPVKEEQPTQNGDALNQEPENVKSDNDQPAAPKKMARMAAPAAPVLLGTVAGDQADIYNQDASIWLPDANLRQLIEDNLNYQYYSGTQAINDSNLWTCVNYAGFKAGVNVREVGVAAKGPITDLTGLEYFTVLNQFILGADTFQVPESEMISFAFAQNLTSFQIDFSGTTWNSSANETVQKYLSGNQKLQFLSLTHLDSTAAAADVMPDLSSYQDLQFIDLVHANLKGTIASYAYLPKLSFFRVNNNQLTGSIPEIGTWTPELTTVDFSDNLLTGVLPDLGAANLHSVDYARNMISMGLSPESIANKEYGSVRAGGQSLNAGKFAVTNSQPSLDPVTNVISYQDFTTGQADKSVKNTLGNFGNGVTIVYTTGSTAGLTDYPAWAATQTDASSWFTVVADPKNAQGFSLVANSKAKSGNYVVRVMTAGDTSGQYNAWVAFTVDNQMTTPPVDPGTPETPTPGETTGTVTIVNVDQNGNVLSKRVQTGTVGDSYTVKADSIDGYQINGSGQASGVYTANGTTVTFTYSAVTTGDGADTVDPADKPTTKKTGQTVKKSTSGQAAVIASDHQKSQSTVAGSQVAHASQGAQAVNLATDGRSVAKQSAKTTLPQTNEQSSVGIVAAGLASLMGALGLAGWQKRRHE